MADVTTTPWGFTLPEVGASDATWGTKLNQNWFTLDDMLATWFNHTGTAPDTLKPAMAPDYIEKNSVIQVNGTKSFRFHDAAGVPQGYLQFNDGAKSMSLALLNSDGSGFQAASLNLTQDGRVTIGAGQATFVNPIVVQAAPVFQDGGSVLVLDIERAWQFQQRGTGGVTDLELHALVGGKSFAITDVTREFGVYISPDTRRISGIGGGLVLGTAGQSIDAMSASEFRMNTATVDTDATRWVYFRKADHSELGAIFSSSSDGAMRIRAKDNSGVIKAQLNLGIDGIASLSVGSWDYLYIANKTAAANDVVTSHLALYGSTYGFNVTSSRLNIVSPATAFVDFVNIGGDITARVDNALDSVAPNDYTIMTRIKGDARYRNADNLDSGTVPVARLPTGTTEASRIANLITLFAEGSLGTYAILCRSSVNSGLTWGNIYTGSTLRKTGFYAQNGSENIIMSGNSVSGSWLCLGEVAAAGSFNSGALFLRVV